MFTHSAQHDGQTLQSILDNYKEWMELWEWPLSVVCATEMKARVRGVQRFMGKFGFLFGYHLGKRLLSQTESRNLRRPQEKQNHWLRAS